MLPSPIGTRRLLKARKRAIDRHKAAVSAQIAEGIRQHREFIEALKTGADMEFPGEYRARAHGVTH